jgi:rubrerythrin
MGGAIYLYEGEIMKKFGSVEEILDFAIEREEEAAKFYTDLAAKVDKQWMSEVFTDFAREEQGHKNKLIAVKEGKRLLSAQQKIQDLKIGDYLVDVTPGPDISYQEALILAMKKEKAAFKLYNDLALSTDHQEIKSLFLALAQEEAKHKLRFEIEYDDNILQWD